MIQESHCTTDTEQKWTDECDCDTYFSNGTSAAHGVMIMISKSLEIEVKEQIKDTDGRFLLLKCKVQGVNFLIYNVYAPNNKKDHLVFLETVKKLLEENDALEYEYMIGAGDWNFTKEEKDRSGGDYTPWTENIALMEEICEKYDLIDIWRVRNPEKIRFTWRRTNPLIQSRIDRIYVSDTMQYNIDKTEIPPGLGSDHSAILISVKPTSSASTSGASFWRFNNSLIKNKEFTDKLNIYLNGDLKKECKELRAGQVKWEFKKFKIKQWCIKESKAIARNRRRHEAEIINKIEVLEEKIATHPNNQIYEELEECKTELEKIHNYKTQSLIIQSRIQIYEEGEKSSKFFLNQIKNNKRKSTIRKLIETDENTDQVTEFTDQDEIMEKLHGFYSSLYEKKKDLQTRKLD